MCFFNYRYTFRAGKKFYCARCKVNVSGAEAFNRHKATHISHPPEAVSVTSGSPQVGPSGVQTYQPNAGTFGSPQAGPSGVQTHQPHGRPVQVGGADPDPYIIERSGVRTFARSAATETTYRVRFNEQWQGRRLADLRRQLHRLFEDLLARGREGVNDNDLLRVILRHEALNNAVVVPMQAAGAMNVDKIMSKVESLLQSDETLSVDHTFQGKCLHYF